MLAVPAVNMPFFVDVSDGSNGDPTTGLLSIGDPLYHLRILASQTIIVFYDDIYYPSQGIADRIFTDILCASRDLFAKRVACCRIYGATLEIFIIRVYPYNIET